MISEIEKLKFPIGECPINKTPKKMEVLKWMQEIAHFPNHLKSTLKHLNPEQLNWKYRPDGWNIKQVIHHCADSHMNSFIRFKLALTEEVPEIRPYNETKWAELSDGVDADISNSILLLEALHSKWFKLLQSLSSNQMNRTFIHPATNEIYSLAENIGIYAWHGKHHLAHIEQAIKSAGKYN